MELVAKLMLGLRARVLYWLMGCTLLMLIQPVASCDVTSTVTYVNDTNQQLVFYWESSIGAGGLIGAKPVDARSSYADHRVDANYLWLRVAATREDGQW